MDTKSTRKLLVLGLDSCEFELLEKYIKFKPHSFFARIIKESKHGRVQNEPGVSGAIWPSFYTGVNVNEHKFYFQEQIENGSYREKLKMYGDYNGFPCFWQQLAAEGYRSVIIDPPKYNSSADENSIQISCWANHDPDAFNDFQTYPETLKPEILEKYGADPLGDNDWGGTGPSNYQVFINALKQNIKRKKTLVIDFIKDYDWNLFFVTFDDLHQSSHILFQEHIRSSSGLEDPLLQILDSVNNAMGEIFKELEEDCHLLIYSSNGMGLNHFSKDAVRECIKLILGEPKSGIESYGLLRNIWLKIPLKYHKKVWKFKTFVRNFISKSNRKKKKFFLLSSAEGDSYIRINVKGREPNGIINSTHEYKEIIDYLCNEFSSLINPETNLPVVNKIIKTQDINAYDQAFDLPDVIIKWDNDQEIKSIIYGDTQIKLNYHKVRKGSHRSKGFFIYRDPENLAESLQKDISSTEFNPMIRSFFNSSSEPFDGIMDRS